MTFTAFKSPVILAGMPVSSHMDVKLQSDGNPKSSTYALPKLPSMALDSGIPAGMTAHIAIMRIAGLEVWLKDFGKVKLFRTRLKDQLRHYVVYLPDEDKLNQFDRRTFNLVHDAHWQIEEYHRAIKQVCNIENFQVRGKQATKNHLFAAILGYVKLQRLTTTQAIRNCYQVRQDLFTSVVRTFISECHIGENSLQPLFSAVVNA